MSSRFPPTHDSRYARGRSRSPARYQEWRPSGPSNPGFSNRHPDFSRGGPDPPRGPKTFNDSNRVSGPGTGPAAPLGPRGRGAPPRPEFRELRDAPPLGTDRSFRDRDFDRRARPVSPRLRSPPRNFRDGPPPRDLDMGRGRRDSRDGSLAMGSTYPDRPPFGQPPFGRGGFGRGRGRGRGDFDFRVDRSRRGPIDDRPPFTPRERSPPSRWGSIARPEREDWRTERRDDDRWLDRDDRERDGDRFRKDTMPINRFDSRLPNDGPTRTPTPHQPVAPTIPPPAERIPQLDQAKDDAANRRFSMSNVTPAVKELRREPLPPQADLMAGRAESSTAKYGSRTSSPPPSGPQVPAFGSFSVKPSVYSGPTSNVWKAPSDVRPSNPPGRTTAAPPAPSPIPKTAPTAPKAQLNAPPPAAPRAPRALEGGPPPFGEPLTDRAPAAPKSWNAVPAPPPPIPTAPWALRNEDRNANHFTQPPPRDGRSLSSSFQPNAPSVPASPRMSLTHAKPSDTGASPSGSVHSQATASENGARDARFARPEVSIPRAGTPPPTAPSGPRRTHSFSTSPVLHSPNIPTAPKAIRGPPVAPRAATDRGMPPRPDRGPIPPSRAPLNAPRAPAWNQWISPRAPVYREAVISTKRDSTGEEKAVQAKPNASPVFQSARRVSEPSSVKVEDKQEEVGSKDPVLSSDQRMNETASETKVVDQAEQVEQTQKPPQTDTGVTQDVLHAAELSSDGFSDDEGMDLDEEDFAQSKAKFERQKAHLESQLIDLSARQYRAVTPLEQIARLARISEKYLGAAGEPPSSTEGRSVEEMNAETKRPQEDVLVAANDEGQKEDQQQNQDDYQNGDREADRDDDQDTDQQELLTPKQEDVEDMMDGPDPLDSIMPAAPPPVEAIQLPYLIKSPLTPLSERGALHETIVRQNASKSAVIAYMEGKAEDGGALQRDLCNEYIEVYRQWQLDLQSLDRSRAEKEKDERQASADPGPDLEASYAAIDAPLFESSRSRLHKFSSEYDIQKVLKESEETARIEQERLDRESKKIQADMEKEAVIPDVFDDEMRQRSVFQDNNRYRSPLHLTDIFGYDPPRDTFTDEEHKRFLELFKDRPKKWGEIAAQLPGRTYADCIHHYYAFKWDGRFRETKGRRKGKGGRGRGGKATPRTRGSALMADLSRGEEDAANPSAFTETGRPRRAATRTTYGERDAESKSVPAASTLGKKGAPAFEPGTEKPAKRRKGATGERGGRRGRQPLAAAPVASPAVHEKEIMPTKEDLARAQSLEEASLLTGLQAGRQRLQADPVTMFAQENLSQSQNPGELGERSRQPGQPPLQRSSASSYWSVPEQTDFIKFISHFGTDFSGIANHMGTKTQTMVKNHYMRLIEGGQKPDLLEAANLANARRERGENIGLPPTPTPITKRRYDNPPTLPRSLVSQGEYMDIDEPLAGTQPSIQMQAQLSQYPQPPRFMTPNQPTPAPQPRVVSNPIQSVGSPAPSKPANSQARSIPPPGPKMGFFSDTRLERRPTVSSLPTSRPMQQVLQMHSQQQQEPSPQQSRAQPEGPNSELMERLQREQARAMNIEAHANHERESQDRFTQPTPQPNIYHSMGLQHPRSVHPGFQDRRPDVEERPTTPGPSASMLSRQGQGMFRGIIGSPAPTAPSPLTLNPSFRPAPVPSPPKRDDFRHGSVPAPSPAQSVANLASPPPAEVRKTSNVMSLLNSEPEEPRPPKNRLSDRNASALFRAQSPAPSNLATNSSSSVFHPRREVFNQTPVSRSDFERPPFTQQAPHVPTPPLQHERLASGTMTPGGSRQEWGTRPPTTQPPLPSSPHPSTPLTTEARSYFPHHRAVLGGLNSQARHNPSPPPNNHPFMQHSRTPSLGQSTTPAPGQTSAMQHVQQPTSSASQTAPSLQSNPYPPPPSAASHMQQLQAQQQSQLRHAHSSSVGPGHPGIHRRPANPEEEYYMQREREVLRDERLRHERMEMDRSMERQHIDRQVREREAHFQAQQQAQAQEQHIYAAQGYGRAPPLSHSSHPQFPAQSAGLSLREQSRREAADAMHRDALNREGQMRRDVYPPEVRDHEQMLQRRYDEEYRYEQSLRDSGYHGGGRMPGYPRR